MYTTVYGDGRLFFLFKFGWIRRYDIRMLAMALVGWYGLSFFAFIDGRITFDILVVFWHILRNYIWVALQIATYVLDFLARSMAFPFRFSAHPSPLFAH